MKFLILVVILHVAVGQQQPGAKWMGSPHFTKGRGGSTPKWLIIHGTAGGASAENIAAGYVNPKSQPVSVHYVIGRDGHVVQCVDESDTAYGNGRIENGADSWWTGNPNRVTISIEHVKPSKDNSEQLSEAQKTASFKLIKDITRRHPAIRTAWANSSGGITGHYSISPKTRDLCPGPYPWDELFKYLNA